ncbi:amino acid ABC transporter permease [Sneathiella chinensis]|uniref:Amino acid ABC transporter permease n=2 Tax=Sneathiella chinensis TaxID=349750 RepID=A0ABQ5TZ52_9PROT|nr:amino acid ABC transporter permease [Sneathiella chinensis]
MLSTFFTPRNLLSNLVQLLMVAAAIGGAYYLFLSTQENLAARHIETGFAFLSQEAGFPIGDSLIDYQSSDSYGYALLVGIINTLYTAILCIILATVVGVIVGVAQVSDNLLIAKIAKTYVEILRNVPVLLILLFVYGVALAGLPSVKQAVEIFPGTFLSQRGLYFPRAIPEDGFIWVAMAFLVAIGLTILMVRWAKKRQNLTGRSLPLFWLGTAILTLVPLSVFWMAGGPVSWDYPALKGFNFSGGAVFRPEFLALVIGLALYRGAFIAENVRSGIMAVSKGQNEAAAALGVPPSRIMRGVILPQALRTIIPATTNDYASLVKDSSLAIAIGYPDMVSIGGTMIGQNGQAIEVIGIWMLVYLSINLVISVLMNVANKKFQLVER